MRKLTVIIIILSVVVLSVYDILAALSGGGATISEVIRDAAYQAPIIPFVFGVICGHWFWSKK